MDRRSLGGLFMFGAGCFGLGVVAHWCFDVYALWREIHR